MMILSALFATRMKLLGIQLDLLLAAYLCDIFLTTHTSTSARNKKIRRKTFSKMDRFQGYRTIYWKTLWSCAPVRPRITLESLYSAIVISRQSDYSFRISWDTKFKFWIVFQGNLHYTPSKYSYYMKHSEQNFIAYGWSMKREWGCHGGLKSEAPFFWRFKTPRTWRSIGFSSLRLSERRSHARKDPNLVR